MATPSNAPKQAHPEPAIRVVMMPRDTNSEGTIFGGVILSYIDQAASVEARRQACLKYVTVKMDEVIFKQPVQVGDCLSLYATATQIGRTSISLHINVVADRYDQPDCAIPVTEADVVMVAVDEAGKPIAIGIK